MANIFESLPAEVRNAHTEAFDRGKREAAKAWTVADSEKKGSATTRREIGKGLAAFSQVDVAAEFAAAFTGE